MFYTGVEEPESKLDQYNVQRIGLAWSSDASNWLLLNGTGFLMEGPHFSQHSWSAYGREDFPWAHDCRDPFVYEQYGTYYLFASVRLYDEDPNLADQAIAYATSTDLVNWTWETYLPVTTGGRTAESPFVVKHENVYYLFWSWGAGSWSTGVRVAASRYIDGPYDIVDTSGLEGYACEAMTGNDPDLYACMKGSQATSRIEFLRLLIVDGDSTPVSTKVFTDCDQDLVDLSDPTKDSDPDLSGMVFTFGDGSTE